MQNVYVVLGAFLLFANQCQPCALPYWWSEQYHFPPFYPQGQPKSTYNYRETYRQFDPNNFIRVQEYTEYTWWEHDGANNHHSNSGYLPADLGQGFPNAGFPKDFGVKGYQPKGPHGMIPRHDIPNSDTNGIVPAGEPDHLTPTKGVVPGGDTNGIEPATEPTSVGPTFDDNNEMIPRVTAGDRETNPEEGRERNENESENLESNDLEVSGETKASYAVVDKDQSAGFLSSWFGGQTVNETKPCKVSEADIHSLRSMIEKMFSVPREHMEHAESKEKAREDILNKFRSFGLQVWTQNFTTPPLKNSNGTEEYTEGVNLIGVIPGSQRGHFEDEIVLVGAHYDTVADSNGVDDNGSGLAVMLEVAKAITEARCRLNNTLMFVAFDHEEDGAMGSNFFVDHYLIPEELKRARAKFQGAFILDGILNYNDVPNTQELPVDYAESLPGLQYFVNNTGNRGNFLAMISRNEMDNHLSKKLMDSWQDLGNHQYKLFNLAVDMGNEVPPPSVIERHLNFLRSDHATFWYHNSSSHFPESLNAVLLTDTGPFRGQMKECYHSKCDDLTVMSPEKLQFAKKTADALTATLVELTSATGRGYQIQTYSINFFIIQVLITCFAIKYLF